MVIFHYSLILFYIENGFFLSLCVIKSCSSQKVKTKPYGHLATKTVCYIAFNQSSSKTVCETVSELAISTGTVEQGKDKTRSDQVQLHTLLLINLSVVE